MAQFSALMIVVLIIAAIISGVVGERRDALEIIVILLLNVTVGFIQELRAEPSLAALRKLAARCGIARSRRHGARRCAYLYGRTTAN